MKTNLKKRVLIVYAYPGVECFRDLLIQAFGESLEIDVVFNLCDMKAALKRCSYDAILINPEMGMVEPHEVIIFAKFSSGESPLYILIEDAFFCDEQKLKNSMGTNDVCVTKANFLKHIKQGLFGASL